MRGQDNQTKAADTYFLKQARVGTKLFGVKHFNMF